METEANKKVRRKIILSRGTVAYDRRRFNGAAFLPLFASIYSWDKRLLITSASKKDSRMKIWFSFPFIFFFSNSIGTCFYGWNAEYIVSCLLKSKIWKRDGNSLGSEFHVIIVLIFKLNILFPRRTISEQIQLWIWYWIWIWSVKPPSKKFVLLQFVSKFFHPAWSFAFPQLLH